MIIINDFNFKDFIQYLIIKLCDIFIKDIKNNSEDIKIKYLIKFYIIIDRVYKCNNDII